MKIGILSMQRVINNGSLLQAYGLMKTIENMGYSVEFVDYKIDKMNNDLLSIIEQRISNIIQKIKVLLKNLKNYGYKSIYLVLRRKKNYKNFLNNYMSVLNLTSKPNYSAKVDILVFGSDEVFNTIQYVEQGKGHAWQLYGADNNAGKLVSYAASFGYTTYEGLEKYNMLDKS